MFLSLFEINLNIIVIVYQDDRKAELAVFSVSVSSYFQEEIGLAES